jgi:hypothetical protein
MCYVIIGQLCLNVSIYYVTTQRRTDLQKSRSHLKNLGAERVTSTSVLRIHIC